MSFLPFIKLKGGSSLLLTVAGLVIIVVVLMMTFVATPADKPPPILGELTIKAQQRESPKNNVSNYQAIKQQQKKEEQAVLRYKERKSEENPFFSFYKEQKSQDSDKESTPTKPPQQAGDKKQIVEDSGFFSITNSDSKKEEQFFEAVFRESQQVQDGRALRIVLKDPIPALNLAVNTVLKGVPYLEGGTRLNIKITAAIVEDTVRPVSLECFDKEDCMEGLYHDDLAQQLEETTKNRLLEEALDLSIGEEEAMVRKGKNVVQKFSDLRKSGRKKIIIERGRELFVALPEQEND